MLKNWVNNHDGKLYFIFLFYFQVQASHFEGLITTIVGYILLAITLIICHVSFNEPVWIHCCLYQGVLISNKAVFHYVFIKVSVMKG